MVSLFLLIMTHRLHIILFLAIAFLVSCQQDIVSSSDMNDEAMESGNYIPGKAVVKVSESLAQRLEAEGGDVLMAGSAVQRTFSHGGKYEERMRKMGLHLWFNVEFDESAPLTKAGEDLRNIEGVEHVEYMPIPVINDAASSVFDDPDLKKQWNFRNTGNAITGLLPGCDVNVAPAWERGVVGNSNVIVAVIDGGVDYRHEDLKDNIWHGTDENGKDIVGYSTVFNSSTISPDSHGTHVAGTIAAVNNNNIGVSGIAGGDSAAGIQGVRIMSCEIVVGDSWGNEADAFVWAANHGAVIAQNSWMFLSSNNLEDTPEHIKKAIDYFNTYAGCDEDGNQLPDSPMKGGVVLFAAGNDAQSKAYPASYEGCIAVSAVAGDYKLAYYSNFGDWVDIIAPGGDTSKNQGILSTVPDNGYERFQGTSMACPHVSGVAALGLAYVKRLLNEGKKFNDKDYITREDFTALLLSSVNDIDSKLSSGYKYLGVDDSTGAENAPRPYTSYQHQMGTGTLDAWKFMMNLEGTPTLTVKAGVKGSYDLSNYFGDGSEHLTFYPYAEIEEETLVSLGLIGIPVIKDGKLVIDPGKVGSGKIKITAIAGGDRVSQYVTGDWTGNGDYVTIPNNGGGMGGTYITREISVVSRGVASKNGGWL